MSLLQPDMIVLDEHLLSQYVEARATDADTVERPVVAVVNHFADELLAAAASSGVRGFLSLSSTPAEVARVVVAAARGDALLDGAMFTRLTENRAADTGEAISLTARELEVRDLLAEGAGGQTDCHAARHLGEDGREARERHAAEDRDT
ncbi:hypothetical protein MN0502_07550 [Arthrobacter sp. MN05-02]|nr:hypothetical protein MN0502_07550 [Arthrobacter sp. MN05-02]